MKFVLPQVPANAHVQEDMRWSAVPTTLLAALAFAAPATAQVVNLTVPAARDTTPVVLSGKELGSWAVPSNQTVQPPLMDVKDCPYTVNQEKLTDDEPWGQGGDNTTEAFEQNCPDGYDPHNHYADPAVDTADSGQHPAGPAVNRLLAYRWDGGAKRFAQIPFQVDEQFTRYLDNSASGFAIYSGQDQHTTYAYPREGFRYDKSDPSDPCKAVASSPAAVDPVAGLDHQIGRAHV